MGEEEKVYTQPKTQPKVCISPRNGNVLPPLPKGKSGNPKGHSKARRELKEFEDYISEHPGDWEKIIAKGVEKAKGGNFAFWNSVVERLKGKVPQKMEGGALVGELKIVYNVLNVEQKEKIEKLHKQIDNL